MIKIMFVAVLLSLSRVANADFNNFCPPPGPNSYYSCTVMVTFPPITIPINGPQSSSVPEPDSSLLIVLGGLAMWWLRRR